MVSKKKILALSTGSALLFTGLLQLPATAAPLASSSGQAVEINIAGERVLTAPRTSSLDSENGVTYGGVENPVPDLLPGLLRLGVITQTADSYVGAEGGQGSESYSQVASAGLDLANIDGANAVAIPPVEQILENALEELDLGNLSSDQLSELGLDLGLLGITIDQLVDEVETAVNGTAGAITPEITALLDRLDTNVELDLGAITSNADANCLDGDITLSGNGNVADSRIVATIGGEELVIATLPSASEANTNFTANLTAVTDALRTEALDDISDNLDVILQGQLSGPYSQLTGVIRDSILSQIDEALAPLFNALNESVISGTINKQSSTSNSIDVTALELQVLPGAADFGLTSVSDLRISRSQATVADCTSGGNDDGDNPDGGGSDDGDNPNGGGSSPLPNNGSKQSPASNVKTSDPVARVESGK